MTATASDLQNFHYNQLYYLKARHAFEISQK